MSTRSIIITVVVIVGLLLIGGGGFFLYQNYQKSNKSQAQTNPQANTESQMTLPEANTSPIQKDSIKNILFSRTNKQCNFKDDTNSFGTLYIGKDSVRGDFSVQSGQTITKSHLISNGTTAYIWMDGNDTGIKTTLAKTESTIKDQKTVDINKPVDYQCSEWKIDGSVLAVPFNVKFTDISGIVPTEASSNAKVSVNPTGTGSSSATSCVDCNKLSGKSKTQCLTSLKCD